MDIQKMISYKTILFASVLIYFSTACFADIPSVNLYNVEKRNVFSEPKSKQLNLSIKDNAYLKMPTIASYTQLNPLKPDAIYTIRPYPFTSTLPTIGKWMITSGIDKLKIKNTAPAHWVNLLNAKNQYIIEPINYLFVVHASNENKAIEKFISIANKAEFHGIASDFHTDGYSALIGNKYWKQMRNNAGLSMTFSNGDFRVQNDHFRIFGAYPLKIKDKQVYIFTASISEESGIKPEWIKYTSDQLKKLQKKIIEEYEKTGNLANYGHVFVSFSNARNNLAVALIQSGYPTYYAILNNVTNTSIESTEDHDGKVFITVIG